MAEGLSFMHPIFIVGVPRSGTTLIRMILNSHPKIYSGAETPWLGGNYGMPSPEVSFRGLFARMKSDLYSPIHTMKSVDQELIRKIFRESIGKIFEHHRKETGKTIWVEKTPDNIVQIPFLNEIFPDAKFIHILRDGRDVAHSTINITEWKFLNYFIIKDDGRYKNDPGMLNLLLWKFWSFISQSPYKKIMPSKTRSWLQNNFFPWSLCKPPKVSDSNLESYAKYNPLPNTFFYALWRWREWIEKYERDVTRLGINNLEIRYEDVINKPIESFSRIFDYIGETWLPETLAYKQYFHESVEASAGEKSCLEHNGLNRQNIYKWKTELTYRQKMAVSKHFDDFLVKKGYERSV